MLRLIALLVFVGVASSAEVGVAAGDEGDWYGSLSERLLLVATIVGAIATLPTLIEFLIDRRKRRERIGLSLDDETVEGLRPRIAGFEDLLASIADLVDAARTPARYRGATAGNEILIIGGSMSGKKSLAQRIAVDAGFDRLITVYNPRNADALAFAKTLIARYARLKVMLLIPGIDRAFERDDDDLHAELDALIETSSERENVLVVATATRFQPDDQIDNLFGVKLVLPGTRFGEATARVVSDEALAVLGKVAGHYLDQALAAGFTLAGIDRAQVLGLMLGVAGNAAEVEDIIKLARATAIHRAGAARRPEIDEADLRLAISRVIVNTSIR